MCHWEALSIHENDFQRGPKNITNNNNNNNNNSNNDNSNNNNNSNNDNSNNNNNNCGERAKPASRNIFQAVHLWGFTGNPQHMHCACQSQKLLRLSFFGWTGFDP